MAERPHVVILGAGFAGVGALRKLEKSPVRVTLIDRNEYHTFQPLLYQVATDQLGAQEVGFPARELVQGRDGFDFMRGEVTGIDLEAREVSLVGRPPLRYDYLVIGLGAIVNFFGTPGAAEHSFPLYTMQDALRLRQHIAERLRTSSTDISQAEDGALRFIVVGGGATGVEIAGAISELLIAELKHDYPGLATDAAEVHVFEMAPQLLTPFKPHLRDYAKEALEKRKVKVHLGLGVTQVEPTRVHLKSGEVIKAHTLVWAAGLTANPLVGTLGQELERGRTPAEPDLALRGHPEVFVAGDIAMITDTKTNEKLPQLGSVAMQAGERAGENIALIVEGKRSQPFEYTDKGTMATIGRGAAIVELKSGRTMTGRAAWLAWLGVHLMLLAGGQQKAHTIVNWGWDILSRGQDRNLDEDEDDGQP